MTSNHRQFRSKMWWSSASRPDYWADDEYYGNGQATVSRDTIKLCSGEARIRNSDFLVGYHNYARTKYYTFEPAETLDGICGGYITSRFPSQ